MLSSGVPGRRHCPLPATPVGQAVALAPRTALPSPTPPPPPDATHRSQPRRPQRPHRPRRRPQGEGISEEIDVATPGRSRRKKATNRHNPGCSQPCHHIGWHTPQQTGRSRMLGRFALITRNDFRKHGSIFAKIAIPCSGEGRVGVASRSPHAPSFLHAALAFWRFGACEAYTRPQISFIIEHSASILEIWGLRGVQTSTSFLQN